MTKTLVLGKQAVSVTFNEVISRYETSNQAEGKSQRTIVWYTELLMAFSNYMKKELQCHDLSAFNIDTIRNYILHLRNKPKFQGHPYTPQQNKLLSPRTIQCHVRALKALASCYLKYCGRELENAHSAKEDARASAEVLMGQLEMYADLPRDVPGLCAFCAKGKENYVDDEGRFVWVEGEAAFSFGPHEGRLLKDIASENPGFLEWMLGRDFPPDVQDIVTNALRGEFPQAQ